VCGIAGFSGHPAVKVSDAVLDRIDHRGPDGRGRYNSACGSVSLFHTRLAILDPTPNGAQPMATADGQVVITFNGEIYNFRELRSELEKRGYAFCSHTDTEVLLALYLKHGTTLLEKLNGIYAFALWDARSELLFVARDGLGVKPLYFSESGGAFAFASEIKALLCFPWVPRTLDPQALAHYLRYLWCPSPRTPLAEVHKLEPGTALIVREGHVVKCWRHYTLSAPGPDMSRSIADWTADVRRVLAAAVERQMVSDVPLGAFLSGGLDSSAIVACARQRTTERLQCFTIDFGEQLAKQEGFERDLPYAERVAKHLDVDLHVVRVDSGMAGELARMVWQLDEPQADFSALNVLFISRLARQHGIEVLLSGAGGDDLFTGYRRHRALGLNTVWNRMPRRLRGFLAGGAERLPGRPPLLRRIAKLLTVAKFDGDAQLASYFDWASARTVRNLFVPELAQTLNEEPLLDALQSMPAMATSLQRMLLLEQRYFLADHNLNYTDKMSMAAGVEVRVPFLDPDLVALAARIPDRLRQHGAESKWVLKKAMEGTLPNDVIYRPKMGFGAPLRAWLRGPLKSMMHDQLSTDTLRKRGLFDPSAVAQLVSENEKGHTDNAGSILSLMCIELWCQEFIDRDTGGLGAQPNDAGVRARNIYSVPFHRPWSPVRQVPHTDPS
jgi:asparagine synthase (glutamine-hydrolysing)